MKIHKRESTNIKSIVLDDIEFTCFHDSTCLEDDRAGEDVYFETKVHGSFVPIFKAIENQNIFKFSTIEQDDEDLKYVVVIEITFEELKKLYETT